jgi:hypothetical protein
MANSTDINNLKTWLNHTIAWLNVDHATGSLQKPHQQMLELMQKARAENHSSAVWENIEQLEELTTQSGIQEQGEILLNCAKMAGDLENLKEAARLCSGAEAKFRSYPHQHGVSLWMFGCIQWASHQRVKAISSWREAILIFRARQASLQLDAKRVVWYDLMLPKFEKYLETAINKDDLPEYEDVPTASPTTPVSSPSASSMDILKWLSIPVSDSVPAGGFGAVGHDPEKAPLGVTEVFIEDEPYSVNSIRRNAQQMNSVVINPAERYHTVRVTGNSMNDAKPIPIENGDYILVRLQNNARDNDIVIANLNDPSPRGTVKRLGFTGGRITLRPESLDPTIQNDPDFDRAYSMDEVRISGIVEAVFKKKSG